MTPWMWSAAGLLAVCVLVIYGAMIVAAVCVLPNDEDE